MSLAFKSSSVVSKRFLAIRFPLPFLFYFPRSRGFCFHFSLLFAGRFFWDFIRRSQQCTEKTLGTSTITGEFGFLGFLLAFLLLLLVFFFFSLSFFSVFICIFFFVFFLCEFLWDLFFSFFFRPLGFSLFSEGRRTKERLILSHREEGQTVHCALS